MKENQGFFLPNKQDTRGIAKAAKYRPIGQKYTGLYRAQFHLLGQAAILRSIPKFDGR